VVKFDNILGVAQRQTDIVEFSCSWLRKTRARRDKSL